MRFILGEGVDFIEDWGQINRSFRPFALKHVLNWSKLEFKSRNFQQDLFGAVLLGASRLRSRDFIFHVDNLRHSERSANKNLVNMNNTLNSLKITRKILKEK